MNYRIPVATLAVAFALASTPCFAAHDATASSVRAGQPSTTASSAPQRANPMIVTVHKVFFFKALDRNHNGQLTRAELPKEMVNLRRNFKRADFNDNGQISPREYILYAQGLAPEYTGTAHAYTYVISRSIPDVEWISMAK